MKKLTVSNSTAQNISLPGVGVLVPGESKTVNVSDNQFEKMTDLQSLKNLGYVTFTVGDDAARDDALEKGWFVSAEQTGNGSAQNVAHTLGVVPSKVVVIPTDLTPATVGQYSAVQGTHTATNCVVTVTNGKKYVVQAFA